MSHSENDRTVDQRDFEFTDEELALIDKGVDSVAAGRTFTTEEVRAYARKQAAEWLTKGDLSA